MLYIQDVSISVHMLPKQTYAYAILLVIFFYAAFWEADMLCLYFFLLDDLFCKDTKCN